MTTGCLICDAATVHAVLQINDRAFEFGERVGRESMAYDLRRLLHAAAAEGANEASASRWPLPSKLP